MSSDNSHSEVNDVPQPHHRIVRVPPGESVVLNSAERAPYLLLIEILNDDLDFDPARRTNKEILKKMVLKDEDKADVKDLYPFDSPSTYRFRLADTTNGDTTEVTSALDVIPPTPTTASLDDVEIDLVEQLYGDDLSRTVDISESIVLPRAPKNKDLDAVAWSSIPPSPAPENGLPQISASDTPSHKSNNSVESIRNPISLDEYSARMRTAAIMLAQLNANLVDSASSPASVDRQSGVKSWIPGSSWLSTSTSLSKDTQPMLPARLKLQPAEATAIRGRIMHEMMALEEERMERMRGAESIQFGDFDSGNLAEDEGIIRRELNKEDPSAVVFSESWEAKKVSLTCLSYQPNNLSAEPYPTSFALRTSRQVVFPLYLCAIDLPYSSKLGLRISHH